ncbi:hypothetical protein AW40_28840 [Kosakonia radicincitans UMEnt01/12]|uniref:hypothetical protein n=1 Tax=Kosakonia radicincitans TaxID=283686 RepID=UPI0004617304|nr:hypothetical protein [Kosakonia radicincitans]KDE33216.1 hypothetical protein AW40_28840 [Kosakonia radicincitans UMEnt01/12]
MSVLMIHGIGQENATKEQLLKIWCDSLNTASPGILNGHEIDMAYYGTILADWTSGKSAISMGAESVSIDITDSSEISFFNESFSEAIKALNITEDMISEHTNNDNDKAVPMDSFIARRVVGMAGAIEKISPFEGEVFLRIVKQAYTYLSSQGASTAVDNIVKPLLEKAPSILITHSLGTVIAFKLLREMEANGTKVEIPLFITLGSPLGVEAFKKKLGPPRRKPSFVKNWFNFYDPSDLVALGRNLDATVFGPGIENDGTVDNFTDNAHGIIGYLPHHGVINVIKNHPGE